jgi:hypothetical protein
VALLARTVDPRVVPVRPKDHGLDARLPTAQGTTRRGWQAKRFTDGVHWGQCRESVERAIPFWRVPWITFCFAHELSGDEQTAFTRELEAKYPQIRLDFWPASELERLIRDTEEGRRAAAWLFDHPQADQEAMLRAIAVGGELASTVQAAQRQAVIQQFMDRDPHLQYTMVSSAAGGPETPPAQETVLSVTLGIGGQEVRIDGSERYAGALADLGGGPGFVFSDDDEGRRARETIERLAREGGKETITAGLGAAMPKIPVGLQGLMPEGGVWGAAQVEAREQPPEDAPGPLLPMILCVGEQQIGVTLDVVETVDGWRGTVGGGVGGLEIFHSVRRRGEQLESRVDWRYTRGVGGALEQLVAGKAMLAFVADGRIELRRLSGETVIEAATDPPSDSGEWHSELVEITAFLGYVAEVEAWTGERLEPPAHPSEEDVAALGEAIGRIRQPEAPLTWQRVELDPGASEPGIEGPLQFAWTRPLSIRLFGSVVYLGSELLRFPEGRLVRGGDTLVVLPTGAEGTGTAYFLRPDEAPEEAMRPPGG